MKSISIYNLNQTKALAESFSTLLRQGDIVALYGTLGVGKTAFTRFLVQKLCGMQDVPSPTFTLLQTYDASDFEIFHFDLYRLKKPKEALELGIEDAFYDGASLIEWPEKMGRLLPSKKMLKIQIDCSGDKRTFTFSSDNPVWQERLEQWGPKV